MTMRTLLSIVAFVAAVPAAVQAQSAVRLAPIVGVWQSDTTGGVSARSTCTWTPDRNAVLCEQRITGLPSATSAVNVFIPDSTSGQFSLYVVSRAGQSITPVPLSIAGSLWYYGGKAPGSDGRYYRTVNDFSRADSYGWRQESSPDGTNWTSGAHGQSRRVD